jgi:hypothetical protein
MDYTNPPNVNYMPSIPPYRPFVAGTGDINANEPQPWEQQEKYVRFSHYSCLLNLEKKIQINYVHHLMMQIF